MEILVNAKTAWVYYFPGDPTLLDPEEYGTTQTPSNASVYVLNCLFKFITSTTHGGALSCTAVTYLLVESSSFFSCNINTTYGGAIYFSNPNNGQCVLHEVCGYDCFSTFKWSTYGQFAYIEVNNGSSSKNFFNYSSISRCGNTNYPYPYRTLSLTNGKICCPSFNISMNKCLSRTGIICRPFINSSSVTCSLSYSSLADNNATDSNCIWLFRESAKFEIKNCNIIRNCQAIPDNEGTISTHGDLIIEGSCIIENIATYIFYSTSSSNTITLSNCTVDSTSCNQSLQLISTVKKSFIHGLNHMSTRNCHAEYDSVGSLTVKPYLRYSAKMIFYLSDKKLFYLLRKINFSSVSYIFILCLIHPDPNYHHLEQFLNK